MMNFQINFDNPWLLLVLIPVLLFALLPYFRLAKKYRRNRNRVISVVLHCLIMVLAVTLLAGIGFSYQVPNTENEVILLVDASHSSRFTEQDKDTFVESVIEEKSPSIRMGIVTFGYDQVYAAPLTFDNDELKENYFAAPAPDNSATDFEGALRYARTLISYPESAKFVVISDGDQTDGDVLRYIRTLTAEGITVDTVYFPNENADYEVRIVDVAFPDENIEVDKPVNLTLTLQSNYEGVARFTMYDNGQGTEAQNINLSSGTQTITLSHTFTLGGLHDLDFRIESNNDTLTENNIFHAYYYLEVFDNILILENTEGESSEVETILKEADYSVTVMRIEASDELPDSVDDLRAYDEVILYNVKNETLASVGLDQMLNAYVHEYGGSLFTVGENMYDRDQMYGSVLEQMLPVDVIDYTPPVGVVYIIDASGSMTGEMLTLAKDAVFQSLQTLTSRDWVGVMVLENNYSEALALTPVPQLSEIEAAIDAIEAGGGTNYSPSLQHAGSALSQLSAVQKRHIVLISDAAPGDKLWDNAAEQTGGYGGVIKNNYETHGITCSIVSVSSGGANEDMKAAAEIGHGGFYNTTDMTALAQMLIEDLRAPEIITNNPGLFTPRIDAVTSVVEGVSQSEMPQLGGYYGTRLRDGATQSLITPYEDVPVYAQWDYGVGKVGSFMSDLDGEWAAEFLADDTGVLIVQNIIRTLRPTQSIRPEDVSLVLEEDNYTTDVDIFTQIGEGESVTLSVEGPYGQDVQAAVEIVQPSADDYYSTASVIIREPGVYTITASKLDAHGNVLYSTTVYKAFSYSAEYNVFVDEDACVYLLSDIAQEGNGAVLTDYWEVFDNLVTALERSYDPRILFIILIIVMFLLDVAVRKFKFKWPHEIVRDYKEKKRLMEDNRSVRPGRSTK